MSPPRPAGTPLISLAISELSPLPSYRGKFNRSRNRRITVETRARELRSPPIHTPFLAPPRLTGLPALYQIALDCNSSPPSPPVEAARVRPSRRYVVQFLKLRYRMHFDSLFHDRHFFVLPPTFPSFSNLLFPPGQVFIGTPYD